MSGVPASARGHPDTGIVVEERVEAMPAGIMLNLLFLLVGTALGVIFFGLALWVPVLLAIVATYMAARGSEHATTLIATYAVFGYVLAVFLFGMPLWPAVLVGAGCTVMLCLAMGNKSGDTAVAGKGDPSVIPIILAIVAERAFIFVVDTTAPASLTSFSGNFLDWLGLFVFGTLPGVDPIIGVFFGIVTTGALAVYLVLLLKRIANPVAN